MIFHNITVFYQINDISAETSVKNIAGEKRIPTKNALLKTCWQFSIYFQQAK